MKKELMGGEILSRIHVTIRYLNKKIADSYPKAPHYYVLSEKSTDVGVYRDIEGCLPEVMLIECEEDNLIRLKPGDFKQHKEGIKAIYATIHSFAHEFSGVEIVSKDMLEVRLMTDD